GSVSYFCPGPGIATANNCQPVTNTGWGAAYNVLPGDYNGDGVSDLYLVGTAGLYYCAGPGITTANNCIPKLTGDWKTPYGIYPGDYDGDGTTDLFLINDASRYFVEAGAGHADRVARITNGLGAITNISYKPLTDAAVYTKGTGTNVMGSAYLELQAPMYVVSSVTSSNGVGGSTVGSSYFYWRARAHLAGGGFMGFEVVRSCDTNTIPNICTQTTYTQDYPHQGLPTRVLKFTKDGAVVRYLNLVTNNWNYVTDPLGLRANNPQYRVPQLSQSQEVSYELASGGLAQGAVITNVSTANTYDNLGNPVVISVASDSSDASNQIYRKITTNTYDNDIDGMNPDGSIRWLLGRLRTATVSSTTP
ncbi:MAG: toxin TcdB middle/N-terminal domain-containing protein, partial [Gammaproteobacteria bacterium]|nr:toxin TcdB middle/N-terminal domain-containing protein [Gammaproteobacteria bacterium]